MSYTIDMLLMLRSLINDISVPYTYTDEKLTQLIFTGAKILSLEVGFSYVVDMTNETITPDPDNNTQVLIILKTACMLANSEAKIAAMDAVIVKDGPSFIDLTGAAKNMNDRAKEICETYMQAKIDYIRGINIGQLVGGPVIYDSYDSIRGNTSDLR